MPAMTFANLGNFKLQKWGFLLCNSVHFYFTTNNLGDVYRKIDLDFINGAFAGAYVKAYKL